MVVIVVLIAMMIGELIVGLILALNTAPLLALQPYSRAIHWRNRGGALAHYIAAASMAPVPDFLLASTPAGPSCGRTSTSTAASGAR